MLTNHSLQILAICVNMRHEKTYHYKYILQIICYKLHDECLYICLLLKLLSLHQLGKKVHHMQQYNNKIAQMGLQKNVFKIQNP